MFKRLLKRVLLAFAFILLLGVTSVVGIVLWDLPPASVREYQSLRYEWDEAKRIRRSADERQVNDRKYVERCVELAEKYPNTAVELAALMMADDRGRNLPDRESVSHKLKVRIHAADFDLLAKACSRMGLPSSISADVAAPEILNRAKEHLEHPAAARVLATICSAIASGSESQGPRAHYGEIADLIQTRFPASSDIANFCETLGNGHVSPPWAPQFEPQLKAILRVNQDRWVRCTASLALAEIAHASADRQLEAQQQYQAFLNEFDGQLDYQAQRVETELIRRATQRLESMQYAPIGQSAPEISGIDLDGEPMTLSQYRGQVVLLTFWATWCSPCMKLVPHERELVRKYEAQPFAVVGVNADSDLAAAKNAVSAKEITWRSFRDKGPDGGEISDEWNALFPTVYLIDHQGIVRQRFSGNPEPKVLEQEVAGLLASANGNQGE